MAYYRRDEQETIYNYDVIEDRWRVFSTYRPHIRVILERGDADIISKEEDEQERIISIEGYVDSNQIRLFSKLK